MKSTNPNSDPLASIALAAALVLAATVSISALAVGPSTAQETSTAVESSSWTDVVTQGLIGAASRVGSGVKQMVSEPEPADTQAKGEWLEEFADENSDAIESYANQRAYWSTDTNVVALHLEQPRDSDTRYLVYDADNGTMKRLRIQNETPRSVDIELYLKGDLVRNLDTELPEIYSDSIGANKSIDEAMLAGKYCKYSDDIEIEGVMVSADLRCSIFGG